MQGAVPQLLLRSSELCARTFYKYCAASSNIVQSLHVWAGERICSGLASGPGVWLYSVGIINIKPPDMTATAAEKDVFRLDVVHKNRSNKLSISKLHWTPTKFSAKAHGDGMCLRKLKFDLSYKMQQDCI